MTEHRTCRDCINAFSTWWGRETVYVQIVPNGVLHLRNYHVSDSMGPVTRGSRTLCGRHTVRSNAA